MSLSLYICWLNNSMSISHHKTCIHYVDVIALEQLKKPVRMNCGVKKIKLYNLC